MKASEFKTNLAMLRSWRHELEIEGIDDSTVPHGLLSWVIVELEASTEERREVSKLLEHAALVMHEVAPGRHHIDHARTILNRRAR